MAQAPSPSLSVRRLKRGGDVLDPPEPNPPDVLRQSWQFVLLIHGYNNDLKAGTDAYQGFRAVQAEIGRIDKPLIDIYWPGDADWGIVSALYYPLSVGRAQQSAPVLSRTLGEAVALSGFKQIDIVSHSMGGRVAAELIKGLQAVPGILVRRVAFMAAALPTFKLTPGDSSKLREAYDAVVTGGAVSLFSPDDMVLALAFPAGQTLAGSGEGWFPTALGHEQWASPHAPPTLRQQQIYHAGHSDYWGWNKKTLRQARQAGRIVREFLALGPIPERVPEERVPGERVTDEREGVEARETPTRGVESP